VPEVGSLYFQQLLLGPMENFVYLLGAPGVREVAVVDPAWDVDAIEAAAAQDDKIISCAVVSHSHLDHINGLPELLRRHDIPVYAHREEVEFSAELRRLGRTVRPLSAGDRVQVGTLEMQALHTPGHTPGSQCLLYEGALVSGDTVFVNACGRCDLKGGNPEDMYRTIRQVLMKLPPKTQLFPGHDYGDVKISSIEREVEKNPYFQHQDLASFLEHRMRPRRTL
jgi:hydroxyacylglutathione hydrolase